MGLVWKRLGNTEETLLQTRHRQNNSYRGVRTYNFISINYVLTTTEATFYIE